jgi:teichuronic acid biosynthesis glycosyltransferase TuaG
VSTPLEVIAVNDASADATGEILDRLAKRSWPFEFRIVTLRENRGPGEARNAGLQQVTPAAEYVAFQDADDVWLPWKLERQIGWMDRHAGCGWTAHRCGVLGRDDVSSGGQGVLTATRLTRRGLLLRNAVATPAVVARRGLPGRFRRGWRHCEDLMLWLDWLDGGHEGFMLEETMVCLGRRPRTPGGSTGDLEAMHLGEQRVLRTLVSERRMGRGLAWLWAAYARVRYLMRLVRA